MSRIKPPLPEDPSPCPLPTPTSTNSFWHSEPSPLLTAHRSTRDLPEKADVVIIGSGMTGASVAHHLLNDEGSTGNGMNSEERQQLNVVMLEAREACWGATGRNGGHCQPLLLEHPHDPSIPAFELANFHALHRLAATKHIPCEFVAQPGVRAIYSLSNLHATELALHTLQCTAPDMAKLTRITRDEDELAALRVPDAVGAVVTSIAARMWPYKFVARILEDLLTASDLPGGEFNLQTLTPATSLTRSESDGSWTVHTDRGTIQATKLVLATNAYTSHLLPTMSSLIVPVRGQMSALQPLPSVEGENRLTTSFGFAGDGIDDYLIQRPNESGGHLMFGGGRQYKSCVGVADDSSKDERTATYLRKRLVEALGLPERKTEGFGCAYCRPRRIRCSGPKSKDNRCTTCVRSGYPCSPFTGSRTPFTASHEWTGIMGFSRDDLPWVGMVPASLLSPTTPSTTAATEPTNLYLAAGYTGHGMPNTWLCGAGIARALLHPDPSSLKGLEATGVPEAYGISEERVRRARELEQVAVRDRAEMERGRRWGEGEGRVRSGYA